MVRFNSASTALLLSVVYTPETWSNDVNTDVYAFVDLVLQASKALNITIPGCEKYNVPTGNITLNFPPDLGFLFGGRYHWGRRLRRQRCDNQGRVRRYRGYHTGYHPYLYVLRC